MQAEAAILKKGRNRKVHSTRVAMRRARPCSPHHHHPKPESLCQRYPSAVSSSFAVFASTSSKKSTAPAIDPAC